eukprot:TRINITY_DN2658_c1_g1_i3.p1 TRINITY_DN2658_c1_g1~~TRINITY_DN2658_c1_g1_i3.p1  ORF type:complete len:151 (+),score=17.40 TRINITY_DN2658_c1_g1_i3:116-568(+)
MVSSIWLTMSCFSWMIECFSFSNSVCNWAARRLADWSCSLTIDNSYPNLAVCSDIMVDLVGLARDSRRRSIFSWAALSWLLRTAIDDLSSSSDNFSIPLLQQKIDQKISCKKLSRSDDDLIREFDSFQTFVLGLNLLLNEAICRFDSTMS